LARCSFHIAIFYFQAASSPPEDEAEEKPAPRPKAKGTVGMPGMGFGGNLLAEMKMKRLNKKVLLLMDK